MISILKEEPKETKSTHKEGIVAISLLDDVADEDVSVGGASTQEALLNHIGRILVLTHAHHLACQLFYYLIPLLVLPLLQHMLYAVKKCTQTQYYIM